MQAIHAVLRTQATCWTVRRACIREGASSAHLRRHLENTSSLPLLQVLDAPNLRDDFYASLLDWSKQNIVSVAIDTDVWLWHGSNAQVSGACDRHRATTTA